MNESTAAEENQHPAFAFNINSLSSISDEARQVVAAVLLSSMQPMLLKQRSIDSSASNYPLLRQGE